MSNKPEELKIKGLDRKLKQSEIDFMKLIEEQNVKRVLKLKKVRKNNIIVGKLHKNLKLSSPSLIMHFSGFFLRFATWHRCSGYLRILNVRSAAREIP